MDTNLFYEKIEQKFHQLYPSVSVEKTQLQQCISPFQVPISSKVIDKIKKAVQNIYKWSRQNLKTSPHNIENTSVLMAYDFHLDSKQNPRLIEINTNASGFLIVDLIQKTHEIQSPDSLKILKDSFIHEWNLFSKNSTPPKKVIITDENIQQQKLYFEILMYKDWINRWGWDCDVLDVSDIQSDSKGGILTPKKEPIDFLYNRLTDFYLQQHSLIKKAYENKKVCLSPNPQEYFALADKKNLCHLYESSIQNKTNSEVDWDFLKTILIETHIFNPSFWNQRKEFFFKPIKSYGGKGSYRGKSISKNKFENLKDCIAQKFISPMIWKDSNTQQEWKIDLRAYVYEDQVQLFGGRIYQGQLTNFKTLLGGFCLLKEE